MNSGICFDMRLSSQWAESPSTLYGFTLEMREYAESLGCHSVWLSEHHMFDDGYLPQSLAMAAVTD